jgi:hypothetical protein
LSRTDWADIIPTSSGYVYGKIGQASIAMCAGADLGSVKVGTDMAVGDRTRKWFPQAIELLRKRYHPSLAVDELISLTGELNRLVDGVRSAQGIKPPTPAKCTHCGEHSMVLDLSISVNSAIVALGKFKIAEASHVAQLQSAWLKCRRRMGLDRYGKSKAHAHSGHGVWR